MDRSATAGSWAFEAALCLLAPFFFLSVLFSILSPLPILYLHQGFVNRRRARIWAFVAAPIGCLISAIVAGPMAALGFFIFACLPALLMGELLERKISVEATVLTATLATILFLGLIGLTVQEQNTHRPIYVRAKTELVSFVQTLATEVIKKQKQSLGDYSRQEIERVERIAENPDLAVQEGLGFAIAGILLLCAIPVIALVRWNPKNFQQRMGLTRDYIRRWSTPEWLVWPSLACLASLIFDVPYLSVIAGHFVKPLLLLYFFQGISILAYFLDLIRLRGPIRFFVYLTGLIVLSPMIVSFGFFDLWFRFRDRSRTRRPSNT